MNTQQTWLNSIFSEIDFYCNNWPNKRFGNDFPWSLVYVGRKTFANSIRSFGRNFRETIGLRESHSKEWLINKVEALYEARCLFNDDLSKTIFDNTLVLRTIGFERYFFKKPDCFEIIEVVDRSVFTGDGFPRGYLATPLEYTKFRLNKHVGSGQERLLVAPGFFFEMLNGFQQYLIRRSSVSIQPARNNVVYDCGACIGDMSLVFADIVGESGEVHTFDPISLHNRFIQLQAKNNPDLSHVIKTNEVAVGLHTKIFDGIKEDEFSINPGDISISDFSITSLDDYASNRNKNVDYVKMDIEGAEIDAINGAKNLIREDSPMLAISAYHKSDDLWQIPLLIKSLNPSYKLYFGHHSPTSWESVVYATSS